MVFHQAEAKREPLASEAMPALLIMSSGAAQVRADHGAALTALVLLLVFCLGAGAALPLPRLTVEAVRAGT